VNEEDYRRDLRAKALADIRPYVQDTGESQYKTHTKIATSGRRWPTLYRYDAKAEAGAFGGIQVTYWRGSDKAPITTVAEVPFLDGTRLRFVTRGGRGVNKTLTLLAAWGFSGSHYYAVSGVKMRENDLSVFKRGEVTNYGTMSEDGFITIHGTPQPLPTNLELYRAKLAAWFGTPNWRGKKFKACAHEGCTVDITNKPNATLCADHKRQLESERRRNRRAKAKLKVNPTEYVYEVA
jgi:hypothetical protein